MRERGRAIVLIGFMGSGKSSAGRNLARRLKCPRFDTDEMVVNKFERPITDIFARCGEEKFRVAESEMLREICGENLCVVVTGGGILLRAENRQMIRALGTVVQLTADEETLFERISRRKTRPLLETESPRATLSKLLQIRQPLYAEAADWTIDTSGLLHLKVVDEIIGLLEKQKSA